MADTDGSTRVDKIELGFNIEPGATLPFVLADDYRVVVIFRLASGSDSNHVNEECGVFTCDNVVFHFGSPNDEGLPEHPLFKLGLGFYGAFEVHNSPWISSLYPDGENGAEGLHHIVLTFHDTTFECITNRFAFHTESEDRGSLIGRILTKIGTQ